MHKTSLVLHSLTLSSLMRHHRSTGRFLRFKRLTSISEALLLLCFSPASSDFSGSLDSSLESLEVLGVSGMSPDEGLVDGKDCEFDDDEGECEWVDGEVESMID